MRAFCLCLCDVGWRVIGWVCVAVAFAVLGVRCLAWVGWGGWVVGVYIMKGGCDGAILTKPRHIPPTY